MKYVLFLGLILGSLFTQAQGFRFGFKVGGDLHKVDGKAFKDGFQFGYHVGAFSEIDFTNKLGIQPEIYFSQVNLDTASNFSALYSFPNVTKIKLSYLNIPVLLTIKANKFLAFNIGPQFSILVDKNKGLISNGKDAFKTGDFAMLGGIQLRLLKFRVYGRYIVGLNNINDISNSDKWKNQVVHLGVGMTL